MTQALEKHLLGHAPLSNTTLKEFTSKFRYKEFLKKEYILQAGEICDFEGFVVNGMVRVFYLDEKGNEHNLYFATENWWFTEIDSYSNSKPAELFIEAIENSEVLLIYKRDKVASFEKFPELETLFRVMTERVHVNLQRRMIDNLSKTAEQRYQDFIDEHPILSQRLTNIQLAAYLGISHEFLSKIRTRLARAK